MESAYLKNHVGTVLAKAIAETVVAQPANPQEYLALYLLHHLQEEERRAAQASRYKKVSQLEQEWVAEQAIREKNASETIGRGLSRFRAKLAARKAAEERLQAAYEEAAGDAEDLLEQEEAVRQEQRQGNQTKSGENEYEANINADNKQQYEKLQEEEEKLVEVRAEFYRAQRFMLQLQKSHVGQLKTTLCEFKERVRVGKAALETIHDNTAAEELEAAERDWRENTKQEAQQLSEAATRLAAQAMGHHSHDPISVHHVLYRVLRCICYLILDATPKATDSAVKVASLVKPTVLAATLRAFNPVSTYDRAVPLRLERNLPATSDGNGGDDGADDGANGQAGEGEESFPMPQPKTRQVRRAQRVLRALLADAEYLCPVNPADFFDDDAVEADAAQAEEMEGHSGSGQTKKTVREEIEEAEATLAKAAKLKERVEEQTKQRGGVVLWALLKFLTAAVDFRQTRDTIVSLRRELGLEVNSANAEAGSIASLLQELPEDEEEDENNDEVMLNEEGEPDLVEIRRLQARIGTDEDEQLVKLWEAKDARRTRELQNRAEAFRSAAEAEDEEADEEADGAEDA